MFTFAELGMSFLAKKMRGLADAHRKKCEEEYRVSDKDIKLFVQRITKRAEKAAKAGAYNAECAFDDVRKEMCHEPVPEIEEALAQEGFRVEYSRDVKCAGKHCYRNKNQLCGFHYNFHVGYKIHW